MRFLIIFAVIAFVLVGMYNSLVRLRVRVNGAWADIDVQLKRRWELIPNLVETVKGSAGHERETLQAVIDARNRAMSAQSPTEAAAAEGMLAGALGNVFALSEAYPELRAVEAFNGLQGSWTRSRIRSRTRDATTMRSSRLQHEDPGLPDQPSGQPVRPPAPGVLHPRRRASARGAQAELLVTPRRNGRVARAAAGAALVAAAAFVGLGLASPSPVHAQDGRSWRLESFHADIRVLESGTIEVTETMRPSFEGRYNGIFRKIAVEYRTAGLRRGFRLSVESVTDEAGNALRYEADRDGRLSSRSGSGIPDAEDAVRTVRLAYEVRQRPPVPRRGRG